ncbi:serine protease [Kribbella sp. NPDC006257]|uniref:S1 family peptidase n=1 Tax=Kribbella sp. NPDC006257 TaxID=3156738 RepID=UPI0033BBDA71
MAERSTGEGSADNDLPKPPRRIPAWATADEQVTKGARTSIEPRAVAGHPPSSPSGAQRGRRPLPGPGPLAIIPLVIIVLVVGVGAGWLLGSKDDETPVDQPLDTTAVLKASGPSVVRVLASTCAGSGEATGVLFDNGRVLTAASAIRQPVSVAVVTADGRIRRATVNGTSTDGVAVLNLPGRLDTSTAVVAPSVDAGAPRAIIGYDQAGKQSIQDAGTTRQPRALAEFLDPASLGAPVLDRNGQVTGLVTGNTVAAGKVIGLDDLRRYAGSAPGVAAEPTGTCSARGPRSAVQPSLSVPVTALATEIQRLFASYLKALNQHDFLAMQDTYSRELAADSTKEAFDKSHGTSYAFGPVISEIGGTGETRATARMTFAVLFSSQSAGAKGATCARLDLRYKLVREQGRLRIDVATNVSSNQSCDSD